MCRAVFVLGTLPLLILVACGEDKVEDKTVVLDIEGMVCEGCVGPVTQALEKVEGVRAVTVSLAEKSATVRIAGDVDPQRLAAAVEEPYSATVRP
jgi:Cu+-exporting ATPase